MNRNGHDEKTLDLSLGRRPLPKSEVFSSYPFRFMRYLEFTPSGADFKCYTYSEHDSGEDYKAHVFRHRAILSVTAAACYSKMGS